MSDDNIALLDDALEDFELNDEVDEVGDEIELTTDEVLAKIGCVSVSASLCPAFCFATLTDHVDAALGGFKSASCWPPVSIGSATAWYFVLLTRKPPPLMRFVCRR